MRQGHPQQAFGKGGTSQHVEVLRVATSFHGRACPSWHFLALCFLHPCSNKDDVHVGLHLISGARMHRPQSVHVRVHPITRAAVPKSLQRSFRAMRGAQRIHAQTIVTFLFDCIRLPAHPCANHKMIVFECTRSRENLGQKRDHIHVPIIRASMPDTSCYGN